MWNRETNKSEQLTMQFTMHLTRYTINHRLCGCRLIDTHKSKSQQSTMQLNINCGYKTIHTDISQCMSQQLIIANVPMAKRTKHIWTPEPDPHWLLYLYIYYTVHILVGGIPTPLKHMKVSWDHYSQYMENKSHVPNHQPVQNDAKCIIA